MGIYWALYKANPSDFSPLDNAEPLAPRCFGPGDIDEILVGDSDGPLNQFFRDQIEIQSGEHGIYGFSPDSVQRLAARLASIKRSDFATLEVVVRAWDNEEKDWQMIYDDLSAAAERLQRFVAEAASEKNAIRLEVIG